MAAASFQHWAILTGSLLTACGDAAEGPGGADPVAAAASSDPDMAVASAADPEPGPVAPAMISPIGPAAATDCNAPKAEPFVGENATPEVRERLAAAVAPVAAIRWVGAGQATTEDYSPQRLNVMLDVGGTITEVHCG
jgi:hypothetical protein